MDNMDDSENNVKVSDSAYSNSCSNSHSRRSSKSTHSGSSGSSGYGGKLSAASNSNKHEQSRKDNVKKKIQLQTEMQIVEEPQLMECKELEPIPLDLPQVEITEDVDVAMDTPLALPENAVDNMDTSKQLADTKIEDQITAIQELTSVCLETSCQVANTDSNGFSCAISMHDGVVMYTTHNMTTHLGFPKDMWIGRSFIDFVHPKDRNTFASQITNGFAVPKIASGTQPKDQQPTVADCKMVCRIRKYRNLEMGYAIKDRSVAYMPFLLRFSFKDINHDHGKVVYLIIQATPVYSAYKSSHEYKSDAVPFVIKHSAEGMVEYVDIESAQYLGYVPQDLYNVDAFTLYHPDDLPYLKILYEMIVKNGSVAKSMPYRMLTQNGDYVKLKTEWSSFINPWSMKLEFVIGKHQIIEGPVTPDVFVSPPPKPTKLSETEKHRLQLAESHRHGILKMLKDVLTKAAEKVKQQMSERCHNLTMIMEGLLDEQPKAVDDSKVETQEPDSACCERDSEFLGGISPHHENDSGSSVDTPLSYNQLNYNENLQRFFDCHENCSLDENNSMLAICYSSPKPSFSNGMASPKLAHEYNDMSSIGASSLIYHSNSPPACLPDTPTMRLTQSILTKHNSDMEKELAKSRRSRTNKGELAADTRQKKKEHLARCNASYQPTMAGAAAAIQSHGVKRSNTSKYESPNKQQCSQSRRRPVYCASGTHASAAAITASDMYPEYAFASTQPGPSSVTKTPHSSKATQNVRAGPIPHYTNAPMSWSSMSYQHPPSVFGSPDMYSQMQQQTVISQPISYQHLNPLCLPTNNYMQACKSTLPLRTSLPVGQGTWTDRPDDPLASSYQDMEPSLSDTPNIALNRSTAMSFEQQRVVKNVQAKNVEHSAQSGNISDETVDRADGESSYSSFYSSFLKTDSGSAEDSSEPTITRRDTLKKSGPLPASSSDPLKNSSAPKRKVDPPWIESVRVTPELIYKYQVPERPMEEVLRKDMEKIKLLEQPALVNEQLGQLYLDLHLEGVPSRLNLEAGSYSSSIDGDEADCSGAPVKLPRPKREYSQLNIIYEADAPFPPPPSDEEPESEPEKTA